MIYLSLLLACGPGADNLYGDRPGASLAPAEFTAINRGGEERTQPDLLGHPTVVWFYPAAGTGG